jgi:hypothetical protein
VEIQKNMIHINRPSSNESTYKDNLRYVRSFYPHFHTSNYGLPPAALPFGLSDIEYPVAQQFFNHFAIKQFKVPFIVEIQADWIDVTNHTISILQEGLFSSK